MELKEKLVSSFLAFENKVDVDVDSNVHVLHDGKIVKSGTKELALELEEKGYDWIKEELNA